MDIAKAYVDVSDFFDTWVAVMENHTRLMELHDSNIHNGSILIISVPTDRGIATLAEANASGKSYLLCFSTEIENLALDFCRHHDLNDLVTIVAPFFSIPLGDDELDAIYANCLFDLCDDVNPVVDEIWRVLKQGGRVYSVHMGMPSRKIGRAWAWVFRHFPALSHGFHPVSIVPALLNRGFTVLQDRAPERLGFPLRYVEAEKPKAI